MLSNSGGYSTQPVEQSDNELERYHLSKNINGLLMDAKQDHFIKTQLELKKSWPRLQQKIAVTNEFMQQVDDKLQGQVRQLVRGMRQNLVIVKDKNSDRSIRLNKGRTIYTQLLNLKSDKMIQFYLKENATENRYFNNTTAKLEKMGVVRAIQKQVAEDSNVYLEKVGSNLKIFGQAFASGEKYLEGKKIKAFIDRGLSDILIKEYIKQEEPEKYKVLQQVRELASSVLTQYENGMNKKIKDCFEAIQAQVAVINTKDLDTETRMEKVRDDERQLEFP